MRYHNSTHYLRHPSYAGLRTTRTLTQLYHACTQLRRDSRVSFAFCRAQAAARRPRAALRVRPPPTTNATVPLGAWTHVHVFWSWWSRRLATQYTSLRLLLMTYDHGSNARTRAMYLICSWSRSRPAHAHRIVRADGGCVRSVRWSVAAVGSGSAHEARAGPLDHQRSGFGMARSE